MAEIRITWHMTVSVVNGFQFITLSNVWAFLVAQNVKHLPATQETQVQSLGWEDPLKKRTATHCNILAWRIPGTEELGRPQFWRVTKSWT